MYNERYVLSDTSDGTLNEICHAIVRNDVKRRKKTRLVNIKKKYITCAFYMLRSSQSNTY